MKTHPHPLKHKPRDPEMEQIIGWFMVGFNDHPDHEYSFTVRKDGTILPQLEVDLDDDLRTTFFRFLADRDIHNVRFIQHSDTDDKDIEYNPWKS